MAKKLLFENAAGQQLAAQLEEPEGGPAIAYALFAHCFTCGRNLKAVRHISRALAARGIAVLRFDFTGLGDSEGSFADTNFSSNVDDLEAAARFMAIEFEAPHILVGHSLGGATVLQVAARLPTVRAVATIGAPADPAHVKRLLGPATERIAADGVANVTLGGLRPRWIIMDNGRRYDFDGQDLDRIRRIRAVKMSHFILINAP